MSPGAVKKASMRDRQYKAIKKSEMKLGRSDKRAEQVEARAVNKEKARSGESRGFSSTSTSGELASSRGARRSGNGRGHRTRAQLYDDAKKLGIEGRLKMSRDQLQHAVSGAR